MATIFNFVFRKLGIRHHKTILMIQSILSRVNECLKIRNSFAYYILLFYTQNVYFSYVHSIMSLVNMLINYSFFMWSSTPVILLLHFYILRQLEQVVNNFRWNCLVFLSQFSWREQKDKTLCNLTFQNVQKWSEVMFSLSVSGGMAVDGTVDRRECSL